MYELESMSLSGNGAFFMLLSTPV